MMMRLVGSCEAVCVPMPIDVAKGALLAVGVLSENPHHPEAPQRRHAAVSMTTSLRRP